MTFLEIEKAVHKQLESGMVHHSYDSETRAYALLSMNPNDLSRVFESPEFKESIRFYSPLLGPTRLRSMKNGLISYLTLVTRIAIQSGVNAEFSYGLSDYYINYMESLTKESEIIQLLKDITIHYNNLIYRGQQENYSKPVASALRTMRQNLYNRCKVSDIAASLHLEPHYFTALFKQEVGMCPNQYFMNLKMNEAMRLLSLRENSVTYVATALGFTDTAHFSKTFKKKTGMTPKIYAKLDNNKSLEAVPFPKQI